MYYVEMSLKIKVYVILESPYKWDYTIFVFCASFIPCDIMCLDSLTFFKNDRIPFFFKGWMIYHYKE